MLNDDGTPRVFFHQTKNYFTVFITEVEYNGNPFLAKITVEEYGNETRHRAYNVERIKMSALSRAQYSQMKSAYRVHFASNADAISIANLFSLVKQYEKNTIRSL